VSRPLAKFQKKLGAGSGFRAAALAVLALLAAASSEAEPVPRQVLMLQSIDRGNLVLDYFTANFRADVDQQVENPINFVQVTVGPSGFIGAPEQVVVEFIRSAYVDRTRPDLIVAVGGPASAFARRNRSHLFSDVPLLFVAVDQRYLDSEPLGENEAAAAASNDFPRVIDTMLQLLPETRQVFVVNGAGPHAAFWRRQLSQEFGRFRGRVTIVWLEALSLPDLVRRCASLPRDSAIYFLIFGSDATGAAYADERVLDDLHATANAPLFGAQSVYMGRGIVGGSLMPIDEVVRNAASAAVQLLNGALPNSIHVPVQRSAEPMFDWRELRRWGIAESRLPAGSIVRYRSPSLWDEHKLGVLGSLGALLVQSVLIAGLLYQRRGRRRAERDSQRSLALATDASRRQTMSALTTSIAHELGQPLSSMIHNAQALRAMVDADHVPSETMKEILSDIQTQSVQAAQIIERHRAMLRSHQLQRKAIDLHAVVHESLALVAHDLKTREVETTVDLSSTPCVVSGDAVLLQQVLVNLVLNAIDAMAETPKAWRRLTITTALRGADIELSVRDSGPGMPPQIAGTVFTPFVTTKPHGLGIGLTIARTIIDAHDGTIDGRNNPDRGATFTITLRRGKVTDSPGASPGAEMAGQA
jgi:signal transduction histidine kinase